MFNRRRWMTALTVLPFALLAAWAQAQDAGTIERVSGAATITGADNATRPAVANERIRSGDTLSTDGRGEALVKLADNSTVALRANTQFRFNEFKYEQRATDSTVSTLLRGTARMVTGLIGKSRPNNVVISARTATIGIRGTDFEVAIIEEGDSTARAGVYNVVNDGGTNVRLASGPALDVARDQTAFAPERPAPGEAPLQLLDTRPAFFRGGGFDTLMQQLTDQPMRAIQQMPMFR